MASATNTAAQDFPNTVPQSVIDDSRSITHLTEWDASSGGNWQQTIDITDQALSTLGQTVTIPAGMLTQTVGETTYDTNGDAVHTVSASKAQAALEGAIAEGTWWQAHYGDPGVNHTANSLGTELGRVQVAASEYTVTP